MDEFVAASAYEGLARAFAVSCDLQGARDPRDEAEPRRPAPTGECE